MEMEDRNYECECLVLGRGRVPLESNIRWRCCAHDDRYGIQSQCIRYSQCVFRWEIKQKPFCQVHAALYLQHRMCLFCDSFCIQCSNDSESGNFAVCLKTSEPHWTHVACKKENEGRCSHCHSSDFERFRVQSVEELEEFSMYRTVLDLPPVPPEMHINLLCLSDCVGRRMVAEAFDAVIKESSLQSIVSRNGWAGEGKIIQLLKYIMLTSAEPGSFDETLQDGLGEIIKRGDFISLLLLLQFVTVPRSNQYLHLAVKSNQPQMTGILLHYKESDDEDMDLLFYALSHNFLDVAERFLGYGAREKLNGHCILHKSVRQLSLESVLLLIDYGISLYEIDENGQSVLHVLAACNSKLDEDILRKIFEKFPDASYILDLKDSERRTAMELAFSNSNWPLVERLVMKGAVLPSSSVVTNLPDHMRWLVDYSQRNVDLLLLRPHCFPLAIISRDISKGKERFPITLQNCTIDKATANHEFKYLSAVTNIPACSGKCDFSLACNCGSICDAGCSCCWRQVYDKNGCLTDQAIKQAEDGSIGTVLECSANCLCSLSCGSRVAQKGVGVFLEVIRSTKYGWAVRSGQCIPKGQFICEYAGEYITATEADIREDDSYFFETSEGMESCCIDAKRYGNVSRFINHSCSANLVVLRAVWDAFTRHIPHICFFAKRDINKGEELTFDYGAQWWNVKVELFPCKCGSNHCKYKELKKADAK